MKQINKRIALKFIMWVCLFGLVLLAAVICGCGDKEAAKDSGEDQNQPYSVDLTAMDTVMTITAYGDNAQVALDAAEQEVYRLDAMLSTGDQDSQVYLINQNGGGILSDDAKTIYEKSRELWEDTDGLFDIAIYPLMQLWGFTDQTYRVPTDSKLDQTLQLINADDIVYDSTSGELYFQKEGMGIDFGGIAKGYTSGRIMEIMKENGVESGIVSLGGNVQALGTKPDGSAWHVAIKDPDQTENEYLGVLDVTDCAIITSGGYERYFEEDGVVYHHILDPATGYPADSGLTSVTIVSPDGTLADGLSTSLFVMGLDKASQYWRAHADQFDFIVYDGQEVYITQGIADQFTECPYTVNVIKEN